MEIRKTWFSYLTRFLFAFCALYILICGAGALGTGQEYPYLAKGQFMLTLALLLLLCRGATVAAAYAGVERWREKNVLLWRLLEAGAVCAILIASYSLRLWVVQSIPMMPESDYKTCFDIARLLSRDMLLEESPSYCDYIAAFPHVLGYCAVLASVFRMFGESVYVGQVFNIVLAVGTCFICWGIVRMLAGRVAALFALVVTAFWPSMVLYHTFLAPEYLFCFLIFGCLWLSVYLAVRVTPESRGLIGAMLLHVLLGVALACAGAVRPMAVLLVIAICICLACARGKTPIRPRNDLSIASRFIEKGWLRALVVLACYVLASAFIAKCVSFTIDREIARGTATMGYNMMVGLNTESGGGWNEQDSAFLYQMLGEAENAQQAQIACRDLALQRLRGDWRSLVNLFGQKYTTLWSNDDYGVSWNMIFLDQHQQLTAQLEQSLTCVQYWNNIWYLSIVALSALAGLYLLRERGSWSDLLILFFCGTVVLYLLVENQNRGHFHCLYVFAILAAVGLHEMFLDSKYRVVQGDAQKRRQEEVLQQEAEALRRIAAAEAYAQQKQAEGMSNSFDMASALESGHIHVSVSESYLAPEKKDVKESSYGAPE